MKRLLKVVLLGLALLSLHAPAAFPAPPQASREDVLAALGVAPEPSDYVVLVDTSGSMNGERYEGVRTAIASLVGALNADDHLTLITFDATSKVRFRGPVQGDARKVLATLPARPTGARTDIGKGIEAGLDELERPGARGTAALVLITDGEVDAPDSPYAAPDAPAWEELRARAEDLTSERNVAAWAAALQDATDAGLLKGVFPDAVEVSGDQLQARLGALNEDVLDFIARDRLEGDLGAGVMAAWGPDDWRPFPPEEGRREATLVLSSTFSHVPVQVEAPFIESTGDLAIVVEGLPETVTLEPGQTVSVPVTVTHPVRPGAAGALRLTGDVRSPWQDVLAQDLSLAFDPSLTAGEEPISAARAPVRLPADVIVAIAAGAALAVLLVAAAVVALVRRPRLTGTMEIHREGDPVREFLLEGTHVSLAAASAGVVPGLRGTVRAVRSPTGQPARVHLSGRLGDERLKGLLADGEAITVDGWQLRYTAPRTRSLAIMNAGLGHDAAPSGTSPEPSTDSAPTSA